MYATRAFSSRMGSYAPTCTALGRARQLTRSPAVTAAAIYGTRQSNMGLHTTSCRNTTLPKDTTKNEYSSKDAHSKEQDEAILTHEEFVERFTKILERIKEKPLEPVEVDEESAAIHKELTDAMAELFSKVKVEVTPELLEKRQRMREKFPEILGSITDEELDS